MTDRIPLWARVAWAEAEAHGGWGETRRCGPLVAAYVAPGLPINTAWHDGTRPPTDEELADFDAFCAAHGVLPTIQLLSPAAAASLDVLEARGYVLRGVLNLYTHDLPEMREPALPVAELADADAWAALASQGFGPGSEEIMRVVAHAPGARLFAAELEGELAGGGALGVHGGIAALYGMSTRPEWRGQGVQAALLAARLRAASQSGATLASVFVTPGTGSERNVVRSGFQLTALRLTFTRPG